jgi:hypothetical protein
MIRKYRAGLFACIAFAAGQSAAHSVKIPAIAAEDVRAFLLERKVEGFILVEDVANGETVAIASTGAWTNGMLPLSATKLLLGAIASECGMASSASLDKLIAYGIDNEGRKTALQLRHTFGSRAILRDLAKLGFPACGEAQSLNCFSLSPSTSDVEWASTLSLGETNIRIAPAQLSAFLRIVARDGMGDRGRVIPVVTARALRAAMIDTVRVGTAKTVAPIVLRGLILGGKTGTGPSDGKPYDGLFAGFWFADKGRPQRTVVIYLRHGGPGGRWPAQIAAQLTHLLP